jgi:hypothetical protein
MSVRHNWYGTEDGTVWDSTTTLWDDPAIAWDSEDTASGAWFETHYQDWSDVISWTHCWDAEDDGITFYDAVNSSDYPKIAGRRVSSVPDRGSLGNRPLKRDAGYWLSLLTPYVTQTIPGPTLHHNDKRFNGRRCWHFGTEFRTGAELYGTTGLVTRANTGTSEYFNGGVGYGHPFFVASIGRVTESSAGSAHIHDSQIEGNVTLGRYLVDNSYYGTTTGIGELWPSAGVLIDNTQTILFMVYANTTSSWTRIVRFNSDGIKLDTKTNISLTANPAELCRECFLGISAESWVTATGFKAGTISDSEVESIINWALPFLPTPENL